MTSKRIILLALTFFLLLCSLSLVYALDADDLEDLVGYTIIASSNVVGDFEGADYDELVELDNGMIFRFNEYNYPYSYRPTAIALAFPYKSIVFYKLIIDDEIYDVDKIR